VFKKIVIIFFIGILNINNSAFSDDKILKSLKEGKKLIFIRHAIAPGNGDPNNFDINDCSTQRNLDEKGIEESEKIGLFFKNNKIKIDKVLSSQWCRCKDTAKYAFKNFETFNALNSFYDEKFAANEAKQIKDLKNYIKNWNSDKNLVLVTHFVVISSILNTGSSSGEIIISDKKFNIIGSIDMM
jgi:phosphohistidine phosphatase SixA|tara:strand:- start:694 stop:1248 length:555 start_codon:yes stop_codon:yes gene_type:complete